MGLRSAINSDLLSTVYTAESLQYERVHGVSGSVKCRSSLAKNPLRMHLTKWWILVGIWLIVLPVCSVVCEATGGPFLVFSGRTIAEVEYEGKRLTSCKLYELENIEDARYIINALNLPVSPVRFGDMMQVIDDCRQFPNNCTNIDNTTDDTNKVNETADEIDVRWWSLRTGIFPGTKWCGMGDIAKTYEELGIHTNLDRCCRAHDHCPTKLKAFRAGYGLVNLSLYTKSHCECDERFYKCLKDTKNRTADILGNLYFNIFKAQCMKEQVPMVCAEVRPAGSNGKKRCIRWKQSTGRTRMVFSDPEKKY